MGDVIGKNQLRVGDVLLHNSDTWLGKAIRFFDGTEVSHAAIYLGDDAVGEAIAAGLTRRSLSESAAGYEYVIARRLKTGAEMERVRRAAEAYLAQGNRYGYEQIVLLAILGLTRKLKLTPVLRLLLRRVLDAAASALTRLVVDKLGESREPMICSEFVYRAYDEALPQALDVFSLQVGGAIAPPLGERALPRAGTNGDARQAPIARGVHPESLLAWAASPASRYWVANEKEAPRRRRARATAEQAGGEGLDSLVKRYLDEAARDARALASPADEVSDGDLLEAIDTFADRMRAAASARTGRREPPAAPKPNGRGVLGQLPDAISHLFHTAADFVTPGDLLKTDSLYSLGRVGGIPTRERPRTPDPHAGNGKSHIVVVDRKRAPARRALLVGINRYRDARANLKGCVNDVLMMGKLLTEEYGFDANEVRLLTDERATTENIRKRLRWLVADAVPGSVLVFHFSGHGSQVRDRGPEDELDDHMDEILCPHDLDWDDPLTDDELAEVIHLVPPGANLTIVLDCCHSGTGTREFFKEPASGRVPASRYLVPPPDIAFRGAGGVEVRSRHAERTVNLVGDRGLRTVHFGASAILQNAVLLAGCGSDQTSADAWIENDNHGAFTFSLYRTLRERRFAATYADLITGAGAWLGDQGYEQVPRLEAPAGRDALPFLGCDPAAPARRPARHAASRDEGEASDAL